MTVEDLQRLFEQANTDFVQNKYSDALAKYELLLTYDKENIIVRHNYGLTLIKLDRFEEGIVALEIPINAGYTDSYLSRGSAYRALGRYHDAINDFSRAFLQDPTNARAYSNYGNSLREFGMPELATTFLKTSLKLDPSDQVTRLNESIAYLLAGDLKNGWVNYDARWFYQSDLSFKPELPGEEYNGSQDINGKIVCVYCEQGFGDSIQFIRYINILIQLGAKIILVTRKQLVDLFQYNFPDIDIRTEYSNLMYHYHVPLMDLPKCFNTTIDNIPNPEAYLNVKSSLIEKYNNKLGPKTKQRVGIVWSSNSIAFITRFRQVPLEPLLQSLIDADCEIVNIEFDISEEEKEILNKYNVKIVDQDGFDDTAALLKTLDLLVTVDTVYAHLSGALGVKTYVMLADYGMDWRWFLKRKDSPFYNCVKLFRQHGDGNWLSVFQDIQNELKSST